MSKTKAIYNLLTLDDGSVIGFERLKPEIKPLFEKIYERALLNRAIVAYEKVKEEKKSPVKERSDKKIEDAKNALQDAGKKVPYSASNLISSFHEAENRENELKEALKELKNSRIKEKDNITQLYDKIRDVNRDIGLHPGKLKSIRDEKKELLDTLDYHNKLKTKAETEYANSKQAIETDLEKEKQELENLKTAKQEARETYDKTRENWINWGENHGNEDLKKTASMWKKRFAIGDRLRDIKKLMDDSEFKLDECIYGKDDSKIKEKYPVLAWIDEYMEAKKESDIMRARQEENGELDSLYDDEVENENTEEMMLRKKW